MGGAHGAAGPGGVGGVLDGEGLGKAAGQGEDHGQCVLGAGFGVNRRAIGDDGAVGGQGMAEFGCVISLIAGGGEMARQGDGIGVQMVGEANVDSGTSLSEEPFT